MHNDLWDVIYQYFAAQAEIYDKFERLDFDQQLALLAAEDDVPPDPSMLSLSILHGELCEILQQCKDSITLQLDETKSQFVTSTLAIDCDENVLTKQITKIHITQGSLDKYSRATAELKLTASCPKLQRQFAKCNTGGERFFDNLDLFLEQGSGFQFLVELSYFCLAQGFYGKYFTRKEAIKIYKERCLKKLTKPTHFSATRDGDAGKKPSNNAVILRKHNAASA
jgi:hypothetical protein